MKISSYADDLLPMAVIDDIKQAQTIKEKQKKQ